MKWYRPSEKLPNNKSIVVIWYGMGNPVIDGKYDSTVYNWYQLVMYDNNCWKDMEAWPLAKNIRIDGWCEVPRYIKDAERIEKVEEVEKKEEQDKIDDRFTILDL